MSEIDWDKPEEPKSDWVREHVARYAATNGEEGHDWRGTTTLLLTTVGRRSGRPRRTALIYGQEDDCYVVVASKGGHPAQPFWYENLVAHPEVRVQVGSDIFQARARTATSEERPHLWRLMIERWPPYVDYQEKTDREIPVVLLERL